MNWLAQRRKGIAAFVAFVAIAVQQTLPLTPTQHGWAALVAGAAGFVATYGIPNAPATPAALPTAAPTGNGNAEPPPISAPVKE